MNSFSVLSLNCWGVFTPVACEYRHERITAVAELLKEGANGHDIVLLQEIWTDGDFAKVQNLAKQSYPYSNYFHSNLIGSGVCVFSKYPIVETFFHRYSANGFPHRIQHGDWFGGKGVGLARIRLPLGPKSDDSESGGFLLSVYSTHLHAEYSRTNDEYLSHRLTQAYELSSFIRLTSSGSDAVILGGDLNLSPEKLGYRLLRLNSGLKDAWIDNDNAHLNTDKEGLTCDRPGNSFASINAYPERLDYIMYGSLSGTSIKCVNCSLPLGKVPNKEFNYSDHEAVSAKFEISRSVTSAGTLSDVDEIKKARAFTEALEPLATGIKTVERDRIYYIVCLILTVVLLVTNSRLFGGGCIGTFVTFAASIYFFFLVWTIIVVKTSERRALSNTQQSIQHLLRMQS